jgi:uncharacterized protein (TIGR00730 family)
MTTSPLNHKRLEFFDVERDPNWRIFRIMAEFVDGFTFLAALRRTVTIFGSARLPEDSPFYEAARELGRRIAEHGYTVVTGGGPGIMEAANRGATEAGGMSVGLNIRLPFEEKANLYVKQSISFHYFFTRKAMLDYSAQAYVFFPGGVGTCDELFTVLTLIQTGKMEAPMPPILLIGENFWRPLADWMRTTMAEQNGTIKHDDLLLFQITDDLDYAMKVIEEAEERNVI